MTGIIEEPPYSLGDAAEKIKCSQNNLLREAFRGKVEILVNLDLDYGELNGDQEKQLDYIRYFSGEIPSFDKILTVNYELNQENINNPAFLWDLDMPLYSSSIDSNGLTVQFILLDNPNENVDCRNSYVIYKADNSWCLKFVSFENFHTLLNLDDLPNLSELLMKIGESMICCLRKLNKKSFDLRILQFQMPNEEKSDLRDLIRMVANLHKDPLTFRQKVAQGQILGIKIPLSHKRYEPIHIETIKDLLRNDMTNSVILKNGALISRNHSVADLRKIFALEKRGSETNHLIEFRIAVNDCWISEENIVQIKSEKTLELDCSQQSFQESADNIENKNKFVRVEDYYEIVYEEKKIILSTSVGLEYIEFLLKNPGKSISCKDLCIAVKKTIPSEKDYAEGTEELEDGGIYSDGGSIGRSTDEILDSLTRQQYKKRLEDISNQIEIYKETGNTEGVESLSSEAEQIEKELCSNGDFKGHGRKFPTPQEKMRKAVGIAIKRDKKRIEISHSRLYEHLNIYLKTGNSCLYKPDLMGISWE